MTQRVVITGLGALSPIGNTLEENWENVINGVSGIGPLTKQNIEDFPVKVAAEVKDFDISKYIDKKEARKMDLFTQYALAASLMAVKDANLVINEENAERVGVWVGSGIGGIGTFEEQFKVYEKRGYKRVSPFLIPMLIPDMASGQISIAVGAKGINTSTVTACATGTNSIGDAFKAIQRGDADVMIAGGAEAPITEMALAGFAAAKALSFNENPETACRPFDKDRDGFIMGEGAGIVILESLDNALARGARIYAEIVGYGATGDAHHITAPAPNGEGGARAIKAALKDAGLQPEDVDYFNAHGTSTPLNDKFETQAIKTAFGEHAYNMNISSTKSMTGHMLGAAGGIEAIFSVKAIQEGIIPPTINYNTPDEDCDLNYTPNKAVKKEISTALSNSLGFGGHNATLIFKKYNG